MASSAQILGMPSLTEQKRHYLSEAFHAVLKEMAELHDTKQADYGRPATGTDAGDPFANLRAAANFGLSPWIGAAIRAGDKQGRIQAVARGQNLKNESVEDSFLDLAVYAIVGLILYREEQGAYKVKSKVRHKVSIDIEELMGKQLEHFNRHNKFRSMKK
jgi:hypothetical protein